MDTGRDEPGDVGHVEEQVRAHRVRDFSQARKVEPARVGARAHHNHLGLVLVGQPIDFLIVEAFRFPVDGVVDEVVELPGGAEAKTVGEVPPMIEFHGQSRVPRLHEGEVGGHVGLGAGVGLDVGVFGPEQFLRPLDGQPFDNVDPLAAAVVPFAGVALRVLVGQHRTRGREDGRAHVIFRGDEFDP